MHPEVVRFRPRQRTLVRRFLMVFLLGGLILNARFAHTQEQAASSNTGMRAESGTNLPAAIQSALDKQDHRNAQALLEQAYRTDRRPAFLLHLARLSIARKLSTEAADYYRRYRDSVDPEHSDRDFLDEAANYLRSFSAPAAELQIRGPAGEFLYIGSRLIGVLPLPGTVLIPPGNYQFALETGKIRRTTKLPVGLSSDRLTVVILEALDDRTLHTSIQSDPRWLLRLDGPIEPAMAEPIFRAAASYAAEGQNVLVSPDRAAAFIRQQPGLARCLEKRDCRSPLVSHTELAYVFSLQVRPIDSSGTIELQLNTFDVETRTDRGPFLAQSSASTLPIATVNVLRQAVGTISEQARGRVSITSQPAGAQIWQNDRLLDVTPYRHAAFAGPQTFHVVHSGYLAQDISLRVEPTAETASAVALQKAPWQGFGGRPLWRLGLGAALLFSGVVIGGFGVSAWVANGTCGELQPNDGFCPYLSTGQVGTALFTSGAVVATVGALLAFWPAKRREQ